MRPVDRRGGDPVARRGGGPGGGSMSMSSPDPRLEPGLSKGSRLTRALLPIALLLANPDEELASADLCHGASSICSSSLAARNM